MNKAKVHKKLTSFLQKTYELVNDASNASTIAWTSDGMGFTIKSVPDFTEHILPKYFRHNNFASFVRQLNMYDFHKSREEGSDNVFHHQFFIRGRRSLLKEIHRKTSELGVAGEVSSSLSKSDCQRLLSKVQEMQRQHEKLEETVQQLRGENRDMAVHNQDLLVELDSYKAREEKLEGLLRTFSGQLQNLSSTQDSYLRFESLGAEEPLCLMEEDEPSETDFPRKPNTESAFESVSGEDAGEPRQYLPEATTGPPDCGDAEMEAEVEKLLQPKV